MELKNLLGTDSFEVVVDSDIESPSYEEVNDGQLLEKINKDLCALKSNFKVSV